MSNKKRVFGIEELCAVDDYGKVNMYVLAFGRWQSWPILIQVTFIRYGKTYEAIEFEPLSAYPMGFTGEGPKFWETIDAALPEALRQQEVVKSFDKDWKMTPTREDDRPLINFGQHEMYLEELDDYVPCDVFVRRVSNDAFAIALLSTHKEVFSFCSRTVKAKGNTLKSAIEATGGRVIRPVGSFIGTRVK